MLLITFNYCRVFKYCSTIHNTFSGLYSDHYHNHNVIFSYDRKIKIVLKTLLASVSK